MILLFLQCINVLSGDALKKTPIKLNKPTVLVFICILPPHKEQCNKIKSKAARFTKFKLKPQNELCQLSVLECSNVQFVRHRLIVFKKVSCFNPQLLL